MARSNPEDELGFNWLRTPGIYCDTYTASYFKSTNVIRITFGEYTDRDHFPFFRTGVVIPLYDAKRLVRTLERLIQEAETTEKDEATSDEEQTPDA